MYFAVTVSVAAGEINSEADAELKVVEVAGTPVRFTVPKTVFPFMNEIEPVGGFPMPLVFNVAVSVVLPPKATVVEGLAERLSFVAA